MVQDTDWGVLYLFQMQYVTPVFKSSSFAAHGGWPNFLAKLQLNKCDHQYLLVQSDFLCLRPAIFFDILFS